MNEEQFKENLAFLVQKMQDGEIEGHEIGLKEKDKIDDLHEEGSTVPTNQAHLDKAWLDILVGGKNKRQHVQNKSDKIEGGKKKEPEKPVKFDPASVGGVLLAPKELQQNRGKKITLEKFGKRTSEQMEKLFSKKSADLGPVANIKDVKKRPRFASVKMEWTEKHNEQETAETKLVFKDNK